MPTDPAVRAEAARMARSHYAAYEGESLWPVLVIFGLFAAGTAWQPWCRRMVLGRGRSHRAGGGAIGLDAEAAGGAPERPPRAMRTMHYVAGDATSTMLHGDLHFGNILRSRREPWLAIDPKGWSGPLAWDTFTVIAGRREDLQQHDDISRDISDRIQRFSAAAGINPDLAAACCQARGQLVPVPTHHGGSMVRPRVPTSSRPGRSRRKLRFCRSSPVPDSRRLQLRRTTDCRAGERCRPREG